jgi:hypothetical protein
VKAETAALPTMGNTTEQDFVRGLDRVLGEYVGAHLQVDEVFLGVASLGQRRKRELYAEAMEDVVRQCIDHRIRIPPTPPPSAHRAAIAGERSPPSRLATDTVARFSVASASARRSWQVIHRRRCSAADARPGGSGRGLPG